MSVKLESKTFTITGSEQLEALITKNVNMPPTDIAVICHPHPLYQGTMHNKVVTTMHKAYVALGLATLRFNFRGVGASTGSYGDSVGEIADCKAVVDWCLLQWPKINIWLAGFSFGCYIASFVASLSEYNIKNLTTVAPAVTNQPYTKLAKISCPWLVIQGEVDEVIAAREVYSWYQQLVANKTLITIPDASHFFHKKLVDLKDYIINFYQNADSNRAL